MNFGERVRAWGKILTRPLIEGRALAQARMRAREETVVAGYITFLHSPDFYNPTQARMHILEDSAEPTTLTQRDQVLQAVMSDLNMRIEERRDRGVHEFLSEIPDEERRKVVHLQAMERALFAWRKQTVGPEPSVDPETCRSNVERLLGEISKLKTQS